MTMAWRIEQVTPAHVSYTVFIGRGTRGHAGEMRVTLEEFAWLRGTTPEVVLTGRVDLLPEDLR